MEKPLIFGTSNPNKLREIKKLIPHGIALLSMQEVGISEDLPEEQNTITGNAEQKANALFQLCKTNCFAEDTGLEVEALEGAPGVHTARFAGPEKDAQKNMEYLLDQMKNKSNRSARFITVIALHWNGGTFNFKGIVEGEIALQPLGDGGFGYDPVFIPNGYERSFGQLPQHVKNQISHRARAVSKLIAFLEDHI